jgi:hypothetical protein
MGIINKHTRRVFHFFEHEYPQLTLLLEAATTQFPGVSEHEALELFYRANWQRVIDEAAEGRRRFYRDRPEEVDSVMLDQYLSPVLDFED